jgi:GNAT superfamily N-acetyltransferase
MDVALITDFLSNSYWAKGRTAQQVQHTIDNSYCMGAFVAEQQVGFARVVTDYQTIGYIMDVFIVPECQGRGVGKQLMEALLNANELEAVNKFLLRTQDAGAFYQHLGFKAELLEVLTLER